MLNKILLIITLSLLVIQCKSQDKKANNNSLQLEDSQPNDTQKEGPIKVTLKVGESKFVKDLQTTVTFTSVLRDNRCPKPDKRIFDCAGPGAAVVNIQLMGTYTRPVNMTLTTSDRPPNNEYPTLGYFNGYVVRLWDVSPFPTVDDRFTEIKDKYTIDLVFEKGPAPQQQLR